MTAQQHLEIISRLAREDGRYQTEAFLFVSDAIGKTVKWIQEGIIHPLVEDGEREEGQNSFHVSGKELLVGIRLLAQKRWGLLAPHVLRGWGVTGTEDFGEIVFLMVECEELSWHKRECDNREDFADGFDFDTAFTVD